MALFSFKPPIDDTSLFSKEMREHLEVARLTQEDLYEPFHQLLDLCVTSIQAGGKILFFGNGGSAADAQHLATELTVRLKQNRAPIAAIALTTDSSALTAIGNDYGFLHLFERQLQALGRPEDIAIAISTSGKSPNILKGLEAAANIGMMCAGFTGADGGGMNGMAKPLLKVPSRTTSRIQEMHITLGQMLCGALEEKLGLVSNKDA